MSSPRIQQRRPQHSLRHLFAGEFQQPAKWGIGYLFEHELLEVPDSYGSEVRFFKGLVYASAIAYFVRFAKENGDTQMDT